MASTECQEMMHPAADITTHPRARFARSNGQVRKHKQRWPPFGVGDDDDDGQIKVDRRLQRNSTASDRASSCLSVPNNLRHTSHPHSAQHHQHQHQHLQSAAVLPLNRVDHSSSSQNLPESAARRQQHRSSPPMSRTKSLLGGHWSLVYRSALATLLLLLCAASTLTEASSSSSSSFACPADNLIHRLTAPNGSPVNRLATVNQTPECDCTVIQEGGWEINCYATSNENDESKAAKWSAPGLAKEAFDSPDYNLDYNILTVSFTIRYVIGRQLKITCDHGAPVFKPALFQGFGIESIDTFVIAGCELPQHLPLSVILYRTSPKHVFSISQRFGDSSFSINSTGDAGPGELVAPIRALYLTSSKSVAIAQLNTLLSDLDSLEQLTLNDFNLNDIDDHAVESIDRSVPAKRRIGRSASSSNVSDSTAAETTTTKAAVEVEVTTLPADNMEMLTLKPQVGLVNENSSIEEAAMTQPELAKIDEAPVAETTTAVPVPAEITTTKPPAAIEMSVESAEMNAMRTGKDNSTADTASEGEESNDVNVENRPIMMLDENALNLARILPNLRILRLRNFVKESTIPNVLFQIVRGLNKLEYLELDSNSLNQVPPNAVSFAGPSLKKLYLYKNSIKELSERAFTNLTRLEILDLSQNQLTHIEPDTLKPLTSLLYLSLRNNQLRALGEPVLAENSRLVSLDLSQNRNLEPLPERILSGLNNLANFSLAYCNMSAVSTNIQQLLRTVPNLSKLDLKGNQLTNLTLNGLFAWNSKLSKLDVSANQISEINASVFSSNSSQLLELNLNRNRLTELPENLFQNARNIRKLWAAFNSLRETSPMTFIQLRSLEELDLSRNKLTTLNSQVNQLPFGIGANLRKVDLSYNNLTDFDGEINAINWHLYLQMAELDLKHNHFNGTLIVPVFSSSIEPVIDLDLSSNHFTSVSVKHIIVDWPYELTESAFSESGSTSTQSLETNVRLDNNPMQCDCFLFPFLNYTKRPGRLFSKNSHSLVRRTVFLLDPTTSSLTCAEPKSLADQALSHLPLEKLTCTINDRRICPEACRCSYRSLDQAAIIDCDNSHLEELPSQLQLSRYFNISVAESGTETIRQVESIIFQLRNNSIRSIDQLASMFAWPHAHLKKPSFIEIWLDHNNISTIEENLIPATENGSSSSSAMPLLRRLSLCDNRLSYVPIKFLEQFERHAWKPNAGGGGVGAGNASQPNKERKATAESLLYLGGNPINCYNDPMPPESECYIRNFKTWLSTHPDRVADLNSIQCDNSLLDMTELNETSSLVLLNMTDNVICPIAIPPPNNGPLLALSIVCIALASSLFVVSVLYYRNKQTILAFIYIHLQPVFICLSFTEDDLDEDKIYDAFVSYSSSDRDIVMELIEKLEKPLDMSEANMMLQNGRSIHEGKIDQIVPETGYKSSNKSRDIDAEAADGQTRHRLCIHERDWLPGNLISWNIVNSVQNSKRTILVLSPQFIKSIWFQVEFHTAYYQMLEDKIDRLIVIVRGELPPREEMDKDLLFLLSTKTYLVWGEKWFWEKLYYAMPHKKNQSVAKFAKQAKSDHHHANGKLANGKNGALNGSAHKNGLLKWPSSKNAQAEAMKEYVDSTIASHFQLSPLNSNGTAMANGSSTTTTTTTRPAPKSLRNSGTLSNASPATLQALGASASGRSAAAYDNKSFINETHT